MRLLPVFPSKSFWLTLSLALFLVPMLWGQAGTTATMTGVVSDPTGAVVLGAKVAARNPATNLSRDVVTNADGIYRIDLLPIGTYTLTVEASGFKRQVLTGITLDIGQVARLDVKLAVGEMSQQVEVTGAAPLVDTTGSAIGDVIENKTIMDMPLNGRNFQQLALLTAGTVSGQQGSTQEYFASASGNLGFVVSGGRDDQNNFLLDGVNTIDHYFNTLTLTPSIDAIQEFKVLQNAYSTEYGMFGSGQVNISIKSGENRVHGSVYEFLRNDVLDAKNFFDLSNRKKPSFRQNNFGGSFGGPIKQDKAFFFASYEGLRVRQGQTVLSAFPTASERQGVFSQALFDPSSGGPNPFTYAPFGCTPPTSSFTTALSDCTQTTIAAARFGPMANRIISDFFTVPNLFPDTSGLNNVSVGQRLEDRDQFIAKTDFRLSDHNNMFVRYIWARSDQSLPFGKNILTFDPPPPPGFATPVKDDSQNLAIGFTSVLRDNLVNELRLGWNYYYGKRTASNTNVNVPTDVLGLSGPLLPQVDRGFPAFTVSGLSQFGDSDVFNPLFRKNNVFQISDNLAWNKGKHSLKFGGDIRIVAFDTLSNFFTRGFPNFNSVPLTGSFIADFELDRPFAIVRLQGDTSGHFRTKLWGFYFNDEYRMTPRLTVTYGLRYELFPPIHETRDRLALYDEATKSIVVAGDKLPAEASDPNGLLAQYNTLLSFFGLPAVTPVTGKSLGLGSSLTKTDFGRFAPRVGIAYDVTGKGKTVLRAAFGIFNALRDWSGSSDSRNMLPFAAQQVIIDLNRLGVPLPPASYDAMYTPLTTPGNVQLGGIGPSIHQPIGYSEQWTFNLQHQLTKDIALEAAYVGTTGVNLNRLSTSNQEFLSGPNVGTRPNPQFGFFIQEKSGVSSSYQSGFIRMEKRASHGLAVVGSYTFSKSIDTVSSARENGGAPTREQDAYCLRCERALSNFDIRHRFVSNFTYDLPFGPGGMWANSGSGALSKLAEGWQVGGIFTFQSGQPFTPQFPGGTGAGFRFPRPSLDANANKPSDKRTPSEWFNTAAYFEPPFAIPGVPGDNAPGNAGRNSLQGPGFSDVDFILRKMTRFGERYNLEFRAEMFNLLNHPNFNLPDRVFIPNPGCSPDPDPITGIAARCGNTNPNFGQITSARSPRVIQFGVKLSF
jgi:hypothetical protein